MAEAEHLSDIVVNDRFWLKHARSVIEGAPALQVAAAERFQTGIGWFWSLYSAVVLAIVVAAGLSLGQALVLSAPAVLFVLAYVAAMRAAAPVVLSGDPRVPANVEHQHMAAFAERQRRLRIAWVVTLIAVLSLVFATVFVAVQAPGRQMLNARVQPGTPGTIEIVLRNAPKGDVAISVADALGRTIAARTVESRSSGPLTTAVAVFPVPQSARYRVTAQWSEGDEAVSRALWTDKAG